MKILSTFSTTKKSKKEHSKNTNEFLFFFRFFIYKLHLNFIQNTCQRINITENCFKGSWISFFLFLLSFAFKFISFLFLGSSSTGSISSCFSFSVSIFSFFFSTFWLNHVPLWTCVSYQMLWWNVTQCSKIVLKSMF